MPFTWYSYSTARCDDCGATLHFTEVGEHECLGEADRPRQEAINRRNALAKMPTHLLTEEEARQDMTDEEMQEFYYPKVRGER